MSENGLKIAARGVGGGTNVNNSPEHGSVLGGMIGFHCALRFVEATQHYHRPGCSSVLHRSE